jgi:hypothetical protein
MNQDIITLAKEVEIWIASLRYSNNKINENISARDIVTLSDIHSGRTIHSNPLEKIKNIVEYYKIISPVPEEIKNKLLCCIAFLRPKKIKFEFGPVPKTE